MTTKQRIGWIKFGERGELLCGRKFSSKMKGIIYQSCVRSAMLYVRETWCLRENEMAILKRNEKAMCEVELIEKKTSQELGSLLGLKDALDGLAKHSGMQ